MCETEKLKNFFEEENYLDTVENRYCHRKDYTDINNIREFLSQNAKNSYKVFLRAFNEIKFGYYNLENSGEFSFPYGEEFEEKYIIEIRLFNENEEILLQKNDDMSSYKARIIIDDVDKDVKDIQKITTVDDASTLFGKRTIDNRINGDFVKLKESGRKISLIIPSEHRAEYYALITRSYITFDEKTGQAGISYYRYLDIRPEVK